MEGRVGWKRGLVGREGWVEERVGWKGGLGGREG